MKSSNLLLLAVFERAALMLMVLFFLTRLRPFRNLLSKHEHSAVELAGVSLLFCLFAIFSTYTGIPVAGSLVNVRTIAIMSGGILFGPWVGILAGITSGLHRYLIDVHGNTAIPCLISSICAGLLSSYIYLHGGKYRGGKKLLWLYGILAGMFCETLTMGLILLLTPAGVGWDIVSQIAWPMIAGSVCTGLIIKRVQDLDDEKELIAAKQARLALIIAYRTLPYFQDIKHDGLSKACGVIREFLGADAVAITDRQDVLAYVGKGLEYFEKEGHYKIGALTASAIENEQIIVENDLPHYHTADFRSVAIIPLLEHGRVSGTLKIFFCRREGISSSMRELAVGLSHLISTQMEVSRVKHLQEMARKAEFSALQSKINPHFLFNALNAISSLIRHNPSEARQLIARLADYLRYNLSLHDGMIDMQDELNQVQDYIAIEQARFGKKLTVTYEIDKVNIRIPSLLLQPLVENAIIHGIQPQPGPGEVHIEVKRMADRIYVCVRDSGRGIDQEIIDQIGSNHLATTGIGLANVHERLKLLFGQGLKIQRLNPGTLVSFELPLTEPST
ncbi:MAG: sensor histidine kinase [Paludibacterium sp.]|uniref:sensor histidine kinase n=1 Tax=Paludibacterium sp. TaxID=1917523 RepID=UPI002600BC34|nr:sensor histidine kinase [Paludibacterium sp.]MBV8048191.1 sensor histidine kinase [Paludibacterium sp.]MBV8648876.1 sensor histidine kinase [Paludibacterium sp.]